ncbi:uncharacterized protein LOC113146648 [Cyclospora cayetanensis]|uniref:Uncharacterized protein LOC113146648 n=1 Tax=Cyclospora cayetanensis TaxID=88456 RepID=A0A6P6RRK2_9EIME|nr:uncharacterized protein LOC113146648 [Cyclospora cayetanensis]
MTDRTQEFLSLAGVGPWPFPPVPTPLWEALKDQLPLEQQQLQQQQQQQAAALAFTFLAVACSCQRELERVQQKLYRRATRGSSGAATTPDSVGASRDQGVSVSSSESVTAEVSELLQCVRQQQQQAQRLEALGDDVKDLVALQLLRQQQLLQPHKQQVELRDAQAHRHTVLRSLYTSMQEATAELRRREIAALKQQMECTQYFSAAAAFGGGGGAVSGSTRSAEGSVALTAGISAAEAAAAAEAAMRIQQKRQQAHLSERMRQTAAVEAEGPEQQQQEQQQDVELLADEQQLVATLAVDNVDVVVSIQRKLQEIVQTMNVFALKVAEQAEACYEIGSLADAAVANVQGAEKQLATALSRNSKFRIYIVYAFIAMGFLLVFLDFLKSSSPYLV